jgi:hypothetical protein
LIDVLLRVVDQASAAIPGLAERHRFAAPRHEEPVPSCSMAMSARSEE